MNHGFASTIIGEENISYLQPSQLTMKQNIALRR